MLAILIQAVFYDLEDYLPQATQNQSSIIALKQQLLKTVIYNEFTPYLLETLVIEKSCGISVYVSHSTSDYWDGQYKKLDWYKDSRLLCR